MNIEELNIQQQEKISEFGVNTWYVLELLKQFSENTENVSPEWQKFFKSIKINLKEPIREDPKSMNRNGEIVKYPDVKLQEELSPIRGAGVRIIENMNTSLSIPTATSLRSVPVKVLEENRRIINNYFRKTGKPKISYTHIAGWAMVKALESMPVMNFSYSIRNGESFVIRKTDINIGLAIDMQKKDGTRSLIVPNIKKANKMNFRQYFDSYNKIIERAKTNKIEVADFQETTITLTNPGTLGTTSSNPRLMLGQGSIIAIGSIDYPPGFQAASKDVISKLGISKVMNITSTYDHRIIQGAESGLFLSKIDELLTGEENFYERIFDDLKVPLKPLKWSEDINPDEFTQIHNIDEIEKNSKVIQMINMFRVRGHLIANLDPLNTKIKEQPELDPSNYGFTVWDYDRHFITDGLGGIRTASLRDILDMLHQTYCDNIGVEYRHIQDPEEKLWLQNNMESVKNNPVFNARIKKNILLKLVQAESFEKFIEKKYLGHKRFSLEGSETIIPVLDYLLYEAAEDGIIEVILGMSHRGRLNVLANIIGKPMHIIFSEFEEFIDPDSAQGSGDVKYHLGASGEYRTMNDKKIKVSVSSNPSHLEFVNPVVEGIVRARQKNLNDIEKDKVIPVLLHGDAAFAGEGIVSETLNLSQLTGYNTGGTIHIIVNNQIGFTTSPAEARSTVYASDVAKAVQAPIFHVNGDYPESALWVTKLAFEFRMKFHKDVVLDVFGYRRLGHNETDEPAFTQPLLYKAIREHDSVREIYQNKLLNEKIIASEELKEMEINVHSSMDDDFNKIHKKAYEFSDLPSALADDKTEIKKFQGTTAISESVFKKITAGLTGIPDDFNIHPKLNKFIEYRKESLEKDSMIDWSFAEALAFGSLLLENIPIRLSGQDSTRGTFTQRHIVLTDINNGKEIIPLNNIKHGQALIEPLDSLLSEAAVLGFEFGFSVASPSSLVMWEAQFGDFANAAQVIIDNFIATSRKKWKVSSNLVLLLPHGQEGQGPEHSSARMERYLELCAEDYLQVYYPSTPAQYFHLLRNQAKSGIKKPLVIFTPKSLLRHPDARSSRKEFLDGKFMDIIDDFGEKSGISRILLSTGKIYYDLLKYRNDNNIRNTAIIRVEKLYSLNFESLKTILNSYKNAKSHIWVQEEPENMGAWRYIKHQLSGYFGNKFELRGITRKESPSTGPGSYKSYLNSQNELLLKAFD